MFSAATKSAHTQASSANWIDDVFSTYLYTGSGTTQAINNGLDLSTEGGLTWFKSRNAAYGNYLYTTNLTANYYLTSNGTDALSSSPSGTMQFDSTGFTVGNNYYLNNLSNTTYASWSFRKKTKFFDIVTYTGNGANRTISHNLGSTPGCIIIKSTDDGGANWTIYHKNLNSAGYAIRFNASAEFSESTIWNNTAPTSTQFSLGTYGDVNLDGYNYVAYLFASDAGGFGTSGTDNVITCGGYTGNGGTQSINLGYEPQWLMIKRRTGGAGNWNIIDNMRGMTVGNDALLRANLGNAEATVNYVSPTATGFNLVTSDLQVNQSGSDYIYIAIRRPMKPPTSGTEVFKPIYSNNSADSTQTVGFAADWFFGKAASILDDNYVNTRLIQLASDSSTPFNMLITNGTTSGQSTQPIVYNVWNTTAKVGNYLSGINGIYYYFRRASGFFDVVCYTGTGSATTQNHNLGVAPELMIVKKRSFDNTTNWYVYAASQGATSVGILSGTNTFFTSSSYWNNTSPTSSVFSLGSGSNVNQSGTSFVSYLFATVAGVSKVGSYTGTGTTKQVDCGFTGGARFVLIKRTDSAGDWYVWDSARGIVSGNDPYFLMNDGAPQVNNTDYIDPYSAGFEISSTAPAAINANGGSFIFLAIA